MKMDSAKVAALVAENSAHKLDAAVLRTRVQDAVAENDYDGVILSLVKRYCPPGMLGLALTALLASFMSGMAGNVTAFNTVWTYDLYQAYLAPNKSDEHYTWMGRAITVIGILLSIVAAYFASMWTNAMDIIQLVFGFVNAPLFATFLLGMFWARCTGTGAFIGLILGTGTSALFHAVTLSAGNLPGIKGGYLGAAAALSRATWRRTTGSPLPPSPSASRHRGHLAGDPADEDRRRAEGPGLFAHPAVEGRRTELLPASGRLWLDPDHRLCHS